MMTYLQTISDAAFEALKPSYANELDKLKTLKEAWDHVESEYRLERTTMVTKGRETTRVSKGTRRK